MNSHKSRQTIRLALALIGVFVFLLPAVSCGDKAETGGEASMRRLRLPVSGESHAYQTFLATEELDAGRMKFDLPKTAGTKGSAVEVGLVRVDNTASLWGYSGEFKFSVHAGTGFGKKTILDATRKFSLNERVIFRIEELPEGADAIVCEIEKADKGKAEGYEAFRDFRFLAPNLITQRAPRDLDNVIIVSLDTLRPDHLGCYGYRRDTSPNIDAFASRSVLFADAVSPSPWTTPSHFGLFTALNPSAHQNARAFTIEGGKRRQVTAEDLAFFNAQTTLARVLRNSGYYTVAFTGGGSVSSEFGFANGFNLYREYSSYTNTVSPTRAWAHENDTEKIFDAASRWLDENKETKFFLFLHTFECHTPYENDFFVSDGASLIEHRTALYDGDIRTADSYFGRLMEKLGSLGLDSNTIIVLTSDHGDDFYDHYRESDIVPEYEEPIVPQISVVDHAHSLYEELLRVPLIVSAPGIEPATLRIGNQVRLIDVMPTILEIVGVEYGGPAQGVSLVELMKTGVRKTDPAALGEFTELGPERKSIRKDGYKYIWIEDPNEALHNTYKNLRRHELFDLKADPGEQTNLYEEKPHLAAEYHKLLLKELEASQAINKALRKNYRPSGGKEIEIDEDVLNNLRALGYLN